MSGHEPSNSDAINPEIKWWIIIDLFNIKSLHIARIKFWLSQHTL